MVVLLIHLVQKRTDDVRAEAPRVQLLQALLLGDFGGKVLHAFEAQEMQGILRMQ